MRTSPTKNSPYTFYSKGAKRFRKLERGSPNKIPPYTCPSIDKTIEQLNSLTKQLERLRTQNSKLCWIEVLSRKRQCEKFEKCLRIILLTCQEKRYS